MKEIIAVENLIETEGWLCDPTCKKQVFQNFDKTSVLHEDLTQFWTICGRNRDSGVTAILSNKTVAFKNILTSEGEIEDNQRDLKVLKKDVEKLIASKPVGDDTRDWFEAVFKKEISKSNDLGMVDKFYWRVRSGARFGLFR